MREVFYQFMSPRLRALEDVSWDRPHNETFHALVSAGLIGMAAYLWLFTSLFACGLKAFGLFTRRAGRLFWGLTLIGVLVTAAVAVLARGLPYIGVGIAL